MSDYTAHEDRQRHAYDHYQKAGGTRSFEDWATGRRLATDSTRHRPGTSDPGYLVRPFSAPLADREVLDLNLYTPDFIGPVNE